MQYALIILICHSMHLTIKHSVSVTDLDNAIHDKFSHDMKLQFNDWSFESLIPGKDIEDNVCDLCISCRASCNVYIVLYSLFSRQFIQILNILQTLFQIQAYLYKEWCFFFECTSSWYLGQDHQKDEPECFSIQATYHSLKSRQSQVSFCHDRPAKCGCI